MNDYPNAAVLDAFAELVAAEREVAETAALRRKMEAAHREAGERYSVAWDRREEARRRMNGLVLERAGVAGTGGMGGAGETP